MKRFFGLGVAAIAGIALTVLLSNIGGSPTTANAAAGPAISPGTVSGNVVNVNVGVSANPWQAYNIHVTTSLSAGVSLTSIAGANGPLLAWDIPIDQALHARATHDFWLTFDAMRFSGTLGRESALGITALLGLVWLWQRHWHRLSLLLIGVIGGNLWFEVLSGFFGRHRPVFADPLDPLPGPGFPSGHSMTSMLLYGLILVLLLPRLASWRWRLLAALDAALIVLLVGFSRLYMGAHYPTDVLGGYAFGLAWGALVYTSLELWQRRRAQPHSAV